MKYLKLTLFVSLLGLFSCSDDQDWNKRNVTAHDVLQPSSPIVEENLPVQDAGVEEDKNDSVPVIYTAGDTLLVTRADVLKKLTPDTQIEVDYYPDYDNLSVKVIKGSVTIIGQ